VTVIDRFTHKTADGYYTHDVPSNFYPWAGRTLEHFYQAAKPSDPTFRWQTLILTAPTPGAAKKLGRRAPLRADWEDVKLDVMIGLQRLKYSDEYPDNQQWLLGTGDARLEEGNDWGDTFWGVCNGVGENHLGLILMDVRTMLRSPFGQRR
jgi:ribA/ribD-fused uncharacterized protein